MVGAASVRLGPLLCQMPPLAENIVDRLSNPIGYTTLHCIFLQFLVVYYLSLDQRYSDMRLNLPGNHPASFFAKLRRPSHDARSATGAEAAWRRKLRFNGLNVLAASAAMAVLALVVSLSLLAAGTDWHERDRELAIAGAAMAEITLDLEERLGSYANSDTVLEKLDNDFDAKWAEDTLTSPYENDVTSRLLLVVDGDDNVLFCHEHGEHAPAARVAAARLAASALIASIRTRERALKVRQRPILSSSGKDWVLASAMTMLEGKPTLMTAGLVQGDPGPVIPKRAHAPILIFTSDLGNVILPMLRDRAQLRDPVIGLGGRSSGSVSIRLNGALGRPIATIGWTPETPGSTLLIRGLFPILITVGALMAAVTIAYLKSAAGTRALKQSEASAYHHALHDGLSGLPNRRLLMDRISQSLETANRRGDDVALLLLDLDRFKLVNDAYGHLAGDELLREVAHRLCQVARSADTCARLGGDEFVILADDCSASQAALLAKRLVAALSKPVSLSMTTIYIGVSIGISISRNGEGQATDLLRQADMALYKAKEIRGTFHFFEPEMDVALRHRRTLEHDLRRALAEDGLDVVYQAQFDHERLTGVEALLRWTHPRLGAIPPGFFIPIAEEGGLMDELGALVFRKAFTDSHLWPGLKVAVNVSAMQLRQPGFRSSLQELMRALGVDARNFELEITEGILIADDLRTRELLTSLRQMGFTLCLDDFGTGYCGLGYLRRFPIDKIKIDRSFTMDLHADRGVRAVVSAIIDLSRALKIDVIAEGVETEQQKSILAELGCSKVQGFLTGRPVNADEVTALTVR